jgi:hypothetical protein
MSYSLSHCELTIDFLFGFGEVEVEVVNMVEAEAVKGDRFPKIVGGIDQDQEDVLAILTEYHLVSQDVDLIADFNPLLAHVDGGLVWVHLPESNLIAGMFGVLV